MDDQQALLTEERRQRILASLHRDGMVRSVALSARFGVSEDTIRRDLRDLAAAGLVQRVHGGALPRTRTSPRFAARVGEAPRAKEAIAGAVAALIRAGQVVILDAGTTTLEVARQLPPDLRATIITNSPPIAVVLAEHPSVDLHMVGGRLYRDGVAAVGAAAVEKLDSIRADLCVLGVAGLHPEAGITVLDLEESYVKRAMIAGAASVMAMATADKLGTAAPYSLGPLTRLTHLVTERAVPAAELAPYRALGLTIVQA